MSTGESRQVVRVVCRDCPFSTVVDEGGEEPAAVIVEHGRETGHKLSTEPVDDE